MTAIEHAALAVLEPAQRTLALDRAQRVQLPPGMQVFRRGESCRGLPLVVRGSIRVQMTGVCGNEIVLYRIGDDDLCTLSVGCLIASRGYRAEAVVEEPTDALVLPQDVFDTLMAASAPFRRYILASYGSRLDTLMLLVEEIAFHRMDQRLAQCLLARSRGEFVTATHQSLATELGTAREVVSRLLKEFERSGLLRLERGRIQLLAPQHLRSLLNQPCPGDARLSLFD